MGTSIEKCREVAGNEYDECGNCSHFTLTDDVVGKCNIPLPGIVNTVWVICQTSKMRCKLYDAIKGAPRKSDTILVTDIQKTTQIASIG